MSRVVFVAVGVLSALALVLACHDENAPYDGDRSPCSTGAPRTGIPDERGAGEPRNERDPQCVARCGDVSSAFWGASGGPLPTVSAMPTGACSEDGERCQMAVVLEYAKPCCPKRQGQAVRVVCDCREGGWACGQVEYIGGGGCICLPDGGPIPPPFDGGCPPEFGCPGPLDGG